MFGNFVIKFEKSLLFWFCSAYAITAQSAQYVYGNYFNDYSNSYPINFSKLSVRAYTFSSCSKNKTKHSTKGFMWISYATGVRASVNGSFIELKYAEIWE